MMNNSAVMGEKQSDNSGDTQLLRDFCDEAGKGDLERAGLILGREAKELQQMLAGELPVDEDLVMKIRGIAQERGMAISQG